MGYRATMLPDDYDEDWPHQASRIHRLLEEVNSNHVMYIL